MPTFTTSAWYCFEIVRSASVFSSAKPSSGLVSAWLESSEITEHCRYFSLSPRSTASYQVGNCDGSSVIPRLTIARSYSSFRNAWDIVLFQPSAEIVPSFATSARPSPTISVSIAVAAPSGCCRSDAHAPKPPLRSASETLASSTVTPYFIASDAFSRCAQERAVCDAPIPAP